MNPTTDKNDDPLVSRLLKLAHDRGAIAHLKRYWSHTTRHYAYPILGRLDCLGPHRSADTITAALFAVHPAHRLGGPAIGKAALSLGDRKDDHHPYDSHFRRLLAATTLEDVADQLLKLCRRLEREGIALDYNRLAWDLRRWEGDADNIKARWAMDFWQAPSSLASVEQP
jgi:CRISPR type I-E-associated protein CasB/Cse2